MKIKVLKDILGANEQLAKRNRELLDSKGVFAINLMSSPGAGKTSLILQTIRRLKDKVKVGIVEGDISSSWDAEIVAKEDVPVVQINTGGECHLDANMMQTALNNLPLDDIGLLIIENVGNLVCPAEFALGEHRKVMISSTPEGDDKPHKYPVMFTKANVVLVTKIDLLPVMDFNMAAFQKAVKGLNPNAALFKLSAKTGQGIDGWLAWLQQHLHQKSRHQ